MTVTVFTLWLWRHAVS